MAMLAGPRERKRYNLVPRGKALYEDDTRFGTRMLEKMGWSKGKGLGANEDGTQDFVRVRYKNDAQGVGFEDRDDQWTQHEESFTGLLQTLNGKGDDANIAEEAEVTSVGFGFSNAEPNRKVTKKLKEKFSGESLEAKSKQSKARVHYKKFTRGKDLSRYSEKDLANIFGRKATEAEDQQSNDLYQQLATLGKEQPKLAEAEEVVTDKFAGVQTISSGLSVSDYFKQKMEAMKSKLKNGTFMRAGENIEQTALVQDDTEVIQETKVKEKKKKRKRDIQIETTEEEKTTDTVNVEEPKKKKKKNKVVEEEVESLIEKAADIEESSGKDSKKKKTSKKVKQLEELASIEETVVNAINADAPKTKKKKSKRDNQDKQQEPLVEAAQSAVEANSKCPEVLHTISNNAENFGSKKSKKQRYKEESVASNSISINHTKDNDEETSESSMLLSKSKKNKESKRTEVSASPAKKFKKPVSAITSDCEPQSLDSLIAQQNLYSVYTISSFCAEKFRNTDLNRFGGSNMEAISGYALSEDLQLDIRAIPGDGDRIMRLWDCKQDKYKNANPKRVFYQYAKDVRAARKAKKKMPRFQIKTWKRKHAFQGL